MLGSSDFLVYLCNVIHKSMVNKIEDLLTRAQPSENGTIDVWIDDFTPCLRNESTGELVDTEVIRIRRKSFLRTYNKRNGWYTNWADLVEESEIYALVVTGTADIQGLISIQRDSGAQAIYIQWMCSAPWNNKQKAEEPRYTGVGGHLFAIAGNISIESGYDGYIYGFAANKSVLNHYISKLGAVHIGILHPLQFAIETEAMQKILNTYTYDKTNNAEF